MKLYKDSIAEFCPWAGAVNTWNRVTEHDKIDDLEVVLDEIYPDGMSETELNDLLWFEPETVCEWVGIEYDEAG